MTQQGVDTRPILRYGVCPSCDKETSFDLIGVQNWPTEVARKLKVSETQTVWQCRSCDTTLMEPSIQFN